MVWRVPCCLQACAARAVVTPLVAVTEFKIRRHLANIPAELLIARATAELLVRGNEYEDDDETLHVYASGSDDDSDEAPHASASGNEIPIQMDTMDHVMLQVKIVVEEVKQWWMTIPGTNAGPKHVLELALDAHTDVHPKHDQDFPRHLSRLLLRLVLLQDVFLDRDHGDKDRRCVIPFAWERWTARLVAQLAPFAQMVHLKVYGGLYPSILAAVLRGASHLASLYISHINITDEILLVIARKCSKLHTLYLLHNFPWLVISMKAFCAAFFGGATHREVNYAYKKGSLQDIKQTFPKLKNIDLAYGDTEVAREFHKLLLTFYPDLENISCPWKTTYFEDGYQNHGHDVLIPLVSRKRPLAIQNVFFDDNTLYNLGHQFLHQLTCCCPQVQIITLDCNLREPKQRSEVTGNQLVQLKTSWKHLAKLHLNVNSKNHLTQALLLPFLRAHGTKLTTLMVEATSPGQMLHVPTLCILLQECPNLTHLGVRVWSKNMVEAELDDRGHLGIANCLALQEFTLHEEGPGDADEAAAEARHAERWMALLQGVVGAAPNLSSLSLSICSGLASILNKLACNVHILHLHVKDGYEWQPTIDQVCQLVCRLPHLHHLYLEEVCGQLYWRLKRRYQHADLQLHWGNLYGWPRT